MCACDYAAIRVQARAPLRVEVFVRDNVYVDLQLYAIRIQVDQQNVSGVLIAIKGTKRGDCARYMCARVTCVCVCVCESTYPFSMQEAHNMRVRGELP